MGFHHFCSRDIQHIIQTLSCKSFYDCCSGIIEIHSFNFAFDETLGPWKHDAQIFTRKISYIHNYHKPITFVNLLMISLIYISSFCSLPSTACLQEETFYMWLARFAHSLSPRWLLQQSTEPWVCIKFQEFMSCENFCIHSMLQNEGQKCCLFWLFKQSCSNSQDHNVFCCSNHHTRQHSLESPRNKTKNASAFEALPNSYS